MVVAGARRVSWVLADAESSFDLTLDKKTNMHSAFPGGEFEETKMSKDHKVAYLTIISSARKNQEFAIDAEIKISESL